MSAKRALLIGINAYPHLRPLDGCVNDVRLVRSVLMSSFGFPDEQSTVLLDGEATRERVLAALDALVAATGPDDVVVVYFAGHGSRMTDREGDEPSGFDSTLMPFDTGREPHENRDITDDEVHLRLEALAAKTMFTTFVVDACHSGTVTRDAFGTKVRSAPEDRRPVSALPPSPVPKGAAPRARSGASGWTPLDHSYVLIAGCADEEESAEYRPPEGGVHGALTWFLCQELSRLVPGPGGQGASYRDVFERVAARVNGYQRTQHPQIEGQADREVFGVKDLAPLPFVSVTEREADAVALGSGSAHGVSVGSSYAVYPQGTKSPEGGAAIGELEVTLVRPFDAAARVVREDGASPIAPGARAFEKAHAFSGFALRVELVAPEDAPAAELARLLRQSARLELVGEPGKAALRVYRLPARAELKAGDPVPQAGVLDAPAWAVVGEAGQLLTKLKPLGDEPTVAENLEKIAKCRHVLATDNPDPRSRLRGRFALELQRRGKDGSWTKALPEADGGQIVFGEGDEARFEVQSRHDRDAYVTVVDVGIASGLKVLSTQVKLAPGKTHSLEGRLSFPKGFPFLDLADELAGASGIETLRLFVTEQPVDFRSLEQGNVRSSSPLASLLLGDASAVVTRDFEPAPEAEDDWATELRAFTLRRTRAALQGDAAPVAIGRATVAAAGLGGVVSAGRHVPGLDEPTGVSDALQQALGAAGVEARQTVEIADARERPASRGAGEPVVELRLPHPPDGFGQMLLAADELGVLSWRFAESAPATRGSGASAGRTYRIPAGVPQEDAAGPATRGVLGLLGKKVFKELVFPLVDPVLGELGAAFARALESRRRPYRLRSFTPDDYTRDEAATIDREAWARLRSGRALLMLHGTFSRSHLAFAGLPREDMETLHRLYGGRVLAFDHFTLSEDPKQNVRWLLAQMPEDLELTLDIVCHSRGGLVGRLLSEKQGELGLGARRLSVGKLVHVGVPNAGTPLADPAHVSTVLDVFTNLMSFLPDNGVSDTLEMVVEAAKLVAVGAMGGLAGLAAMRPDGEFAKWLNSGGRAGDTRYFAVASDVRPSEPGLKRLALTRGLETVLRGANDFVVPCRGVYAENGSGFFPVEERLVLEGKDAVAHTRYFADARVRAAILGWLGAA